MSPDAGAPDQLESFPELLNRHIQTFLFEFLPKLIQDLTSEAQTGLDASQRTAIDQYFQRIVTLMALAYPRKSLWQWRATPYELVRELHRDFELWCAASGGNAVRRRSELRNRMQDRLGVITNQSLRLALRVKQETLGPLLSEFRNVPTLAHAVGGLGLQAMDDFAERTSSRNVSVTQRPAGSGSPRHLVFLIHGIRTRSTWYLSVRRALQEHGFIVESTNYGYFDLALFLAPMSLVRGRPVRKVFRDVRAAVQKHQAEHVSFIAHSFGTYILSRILKSEFDFAAHRVVFCGSIVAEDFPVEQIQNRFSAPILNEVSPLDIFPILAESVTWGYGPTGAYGFRRPHFNDRWHATAHSGLLNRDTCEGYWIPFLRDGTIVETGNATMPPWHFRIWSTVKVKYVVLAGVIGFLALRYLI